MRKYVRGIALLLTLTLCGTGITNGQIVSEAKKAENAQAKDAAGNQEQDAGKDTVEKPLVEVTADAFEEHLLGKGYKEGNVSIKESAVPDNITLGTDKTGDGLLISGDTGAISSTRFDLGTFRFEQYTAGRMILDGLVERRHNATVYFYLDEETESFAKIRIARQKKKDSWDVTKYMCADVRGKKLTGTHRIYAVPVFDEVGKKATVFLKGLLFSEGSTPVVEFQLDETLGTIAEMNGDISHESECYGEVNIQVPEGYHSEYSEKTFKSGTYELDYVRGRGNSTWFVSKKPYKFKLAEKQDFFGMGSNKHWVLLANYYDYTMLRNKYTYWLGKRMGMEYTPECVFVDLVMNGEYLGSYYLCEQVRVGKARVDIDDLENEKEATDAETISGGYLLSLGSDSSEHAEQKMIETEHEYSFLIENPEFDTYFNKSQYDYIANYLNQTEKAIYGEDFKDEKGISYSDYLDVQAAIDYYLVQEFSLNGDGYLSGSTYLYKKRNGKLYWGPLWDFDYVAWGATETDGHSVEDFVLANRAPWMRRLLQNEDFRQKLIKRWKEMREILKASIQENGQLDQYAKQLYLSQKVNYQVSETLLKDLEEEKQALGKEEEKEKIQDYVLDFDHEVARFKRWIRERIEWVDENIETFYKKENVGIRLVNGDKLYAEVFLDEEGYLSNRQFPADPAKDGYMFAGWYRTNETGEEVRLKSGYYEIPDEPLVFRAKWLKGTPEKIVKGLAFSRKEYYVPAGDEISYLNMGLTVMPFELDVADVKWSVKNEEIAGITESGDISGKKVGETVVTASYAGKKASCKIIVVDWEDITRIKKFQVASKLQIKKGEYAAIPLEYEPVKNVMFRNWNVHYVVKDPMLLQIDGNSAGFVYGKKAGTTMVIVYNEDLEKVQICEVTVKDSSSKASQKASQAKLSVKKKTRIPGESYTIRVKKKNGQKISFSVSKKTKKKGIFVTKTGKIKIAKKTKPGVYTIVVTVKANKEYKAKILKFRLTVAAGKS